MLQDKYATEINTILDKYAQKRSAVLPLLYLAQDEYGYLTQDAIREVAATLDLPYTDVFEVVGFYTLFYDKPVGTWMLQVCDDVPCCYLGAEDLVAGLKQRLNISENQTTSDGMFTLQRVKCLAACDKAPLLQANLDYVYNLTVDKIDDLLRDLRARATDAAALSVSGRLAEDYDAVAGQAPRMIERRLGAVEAPAATQPTAPEQPEAQKAEEQEAESAPEQPAIAEAEQRMAAESPTMASPDRTNSGERPVPEKQDEYGATPATAPQQQNRPPVTDASVEETKTESTRGWRQQEPEASGEKTSPNAPPQAAAEQPPAEDVDPAKPSKDD